MYYKKHLFICTNQKADGKQCCQQADAEAMFHYAKAKLKQASQQGPGLCRVSKSGCLGRCEEGPVAVVYPEGTWYSYQDSDDMDKIIESDLLQGKIVNALKLED